ncbi:MAG: tetratricopeptide repeat protein [Microbacteriaceae bacterium]|jgi:tetratricopeptide (TPR) repeat protein|nr:tetratricopeptide repeat protein [Microbacteriaceae bacterium]
MEQTWDARVAAVWADASDLSDAAMLERIDTLVAERADDDAAALFEAASVRDYLGREEEADPLYRRAIESGLQGERGPQATIQLASTLRNRGRADEAVDLLSSLLAEHEADEWTAAGAAFLSLALASAGREREAASVALVALSENLPVYSDAVLRYAIRLRQR